MGEIQMSFSMDSITWTSWEPFSRERKFTLPPDDGEKTVYLKVKDEAGNVAEPVFDSIVLYTIVLDKKPDDDKKDDKDIDNKTNNNKTTPIEHTETPDDKEKTKDDLNYIYLVLIIVIIIIILLLIFIMVKRKGPGAEKR